VIVEEKLQNSNWLAWRVLWLSLICCVFEGSMRKWGVGDASVAGRLAYLSKDILLTLLLLLGTGRGHALTSMAQPFMCIGLVMIGIGAVASSVSGIEVVGAVLSIRTLVVLPIAAWFAGRLLPSDSLRRFAIWIAILSLPLAALGVLQFYSPSNSPINQYSTEGEYVTTAGVSQRIRATGTFSYITGFGEFAPVAVWAGIVTFTLGVTKWSRMLGYAGLAAGMCCAQTTVSRAPVLISLGLVAVWAVAGGQFRRKAQIAGTIAAAGLTVLFFTEKWDAADEIATTTYQRHLSGGDTFLYRTWYQFVLPMYAMQAAPFGNGLGTEQAGRTATTAGARSESTFESPWGRTIMEFGAIGLIGFLITLGMIFAPLQSAYRMNIRDESRTVLAVTAALLLSKALLGFQFNHVSAYFFWAIGATVLALGSGIQQENDYSDANHV
jgi:hypothetical protein